MTTLLPTLPSSCDPARSCVWSIASLVAWLVRKLIGWLHFYHLEVAFSSLARLNLTTWMPTSRKIGKKAQWWTRSIPP